MSACVAVIDPAISSPATAGFNTMSMLSPFPLTYHLPFLHGITSLFSLDQEKIAGAIILGSNTSVNVPSLRQDLLVSWVQRFCQRQRPLLGICYGHQLLADIFGGKVGYMRDDRKKISGLRTIEVLDNAKLGIKAHKQQFVVSHNEVVTAIPDCFEVFAHSSDFPYEGLHHRELPIWTLQVHADATQDFLRSQDIDLILPPEVEQQGFDLVSSFLAHCKSEFAFTNKKA